VRLKLARYWFAGRAGLWDAAFNLGEMTLTAPRSNWRMERSGMGMLQGRSRDHAVQAALVDALMQTQAALGSKAACSRRTQHHGYKQTGRASRARRGPRSIFFNKMFRGED